MTYIPLEDLKVYQLGVDFSNQSWEVYESLDWKLQKIIGDQFIRSIDSVGANIAEGFGRYHYLDKIKFYYNSRGSLFESKHWIELLFKRKIIDEQKYFDLIEIYNNIKPALNGLINSIYKNKNKSS